MHVAVDSFTVVKKGGNDHRVENTHIDKKKNKKISYLLI